MFLISVLISKLLYTSCGCHVVQVAEENLAKADVSTDISSTRLSRVVIETGISAFAQPAKLLVPLTAFVHSLRIVSLSMQILFNAERIQEATHHVSGVFQGLQIHQS